MAAVETATRTRANNSALVEGNHRIANNLAIVASLVHSQASTLPMDGTVQAADMISLLHQLATKIDAIARLHRLLSSDFTDTATVDLDAYLAEIVDIATNSLAGVERAKVSHDLDCRYSIHAKYAAAVGMLVVEAITNALKYSNCPGKHPDICIKSQKNYGSVTIEIADKGAGSAEGVDLHISGGQGFSLMHAIADELHGHLEFQRGTSGFCLRFVLPISRDDQLVN